MKKIIVKVVALISALASAAVFSFGCGQPPVPKTPVAKMDYAVERAFDSFERAEIPSLIDRVTNGGSIEFRMDMSELMAEAGMGGNISDADASAKLYFRNGGKELALKLDAIMNGRSAADVLAYTNGKYLAMTSAALLNNKAYGINFTNLAESFENSMFSGGLLDLGLPDEITAVLDIFDKLDELGALADRLENLLNRMENDIFAIFERNAVHSTVNGTLTIGGVIVETENITLTYDSNAIFNVVKELMVLFNNSREFKEILAECADMLYSTMGVSEFGFGSADMGSLIMMAFDSVVSEIDNYSSVFDGLGLTVTSYISRQSNELVGASMDVTIPDGNRGTVDIICGPTMSDLREFSVTTNMINANGETVENVKISYLANTDGMGNYNGVLSLSSRYEAYDLVKVTYNKNTGSYDISLNIDGDKVGARGTYMNNGRTASVSLTSVYEGNDVTNLGEISLMFNTSDNMPVVGNYIDILNMDMNQIQEFAMTVSQNASSLSEIFG